MGKHIAAEYCLIIANSLIAVGTGLLSSLPTYKAVWSGTYGYEVISGFALGLASPCAYFLLYTSVDEKDVAVATGALNMMRTLGGCVGIAICSALHGSMLRKDLTSILNPEQVSLVESSNAYVGSLPVKTRERIGRVFGRSYNRQFQVMLAFSCLNIVIALILTVVRKRMGIFGKIPKRQLDNEFMKKQNAENEKAESVNGDDKTAEEKELGQVGASKEELRDADHADEISPKI